MSKKLIEVRVNEINKKKSDDRHNHVTHHFVNLTISIHTTQIKILLQNNLRDSVVKS